MDDQRKYGRAIIHSKGIYACGQVAFYDSGLMQPFGILFPENVTYPDGTKHNNSEAIRCFSCGTKLTDHDVQL